MLEHEAHRHLRSASSLRRSFLDARPHLIESLERRRTLGQLVEPAAQLIERGEPRVEHVPQ